MSELHWVVAQGGWVSYALVGVSVLLWTSVFLRALALRPASALSLDAPVRGRSALAIFLREAQGLRGEPKRLQRLSEQTLRRFATMRSFVRVLVVIAPLLGLLGTVNGMIEMFSSLEGVLGAQGDASVASGISTALVTTQLGLVIAAPGLIAAFWLTRMQMRREREMYGVLALLQQGEA